MDTNTIKNELEATAYAKITVSPSNLSFKSTASSKTIKVTCSDSSWTVGGGNDWCTITKVSNTSAKVSVKANTSDFRSTGVVCVNGSNVATISVTQEVLLDRSKLVTAYKQITNSSCAATCAAMCVNKSPETLKNDGIDLEYAMWSTIATKYGYKSTGPDSTSLKSIYNTLKSGYPVIVQVNTGSMEHWVVVTKYSGNSTTLSADDFTCIDPWDAKTKVLSSATRYSAPNKAVVFKKS